MGELSCGELYGELWSELCGELGVSCFVVFIVFKRVKCSLSYFGPDLILYGFLFYMRGHH